MIQVSDFAIGEGILHPHLKYRFRASFLDSSGKKLEYSPDLERQIVAISSVVQSNDSIVSSFNITIEEDVRNYASKAMQALLKLPSFTVLIEQLDGSCNVVKTTTVTGASVRSIAHSDLDYAGSTLADRFKLQLKIPELLGNKIADLVQKDPSAALLYEMLANSDFSVTCQNNCGSGGAVQAYLTISYNVSSVRVE